MAAHQQHGSYDPCRRIHPVEPLAGIQRDVLLCDPIRSYLGCGRHLFPQTESLLSKQNEGREEPDLGYLEKVIIGCIPAGVIGLPLNDWADENLLNATVVALALIIYGILFIVIENRHKDREPSITDFSQLTYMKAFQIGLFQALSIIPGTSRSGSSILGSIVLGTSRFIATEFSFFMSIPIMFGISFLKIIKFGFNFTGLEFAVLLSGMLTAFLVSIVAIKFLIGYLKRNDFKAFGWYRIVLGAIVLIYFMFV